MTEREALVHCFNLIADLAERVGDQVLASQADYYRDRLTAAQESTPAPEQSGPTSAQLGGPEARNVGLGVNTEAGDQVDEAASPEVVSGAGYCRGDASANPPSTLAPAYPPSKDVPLARGGAGSPSLGVDGGTASHTEVPMPAASSSNDPEQVKRCSNPRCHAADMDMTCDCEQPKPVCGTCNGTRCAHPNFTRACPDCTGAKPSKVKPGDYDPRATDEQCRCPKCGAFRPGYPYHVKDPCLRCGYSPTGCCTVCREPDDIKPEGEP